MAHSVSGIRRFACVRKPVFARLPPVHRRNLALPSIVCGFTQDPSCFLRSVETHRVLGCYEVETPLGLALQFERRRELRIGCAFFLGLHDGVKQIHQRCAATL